MCKKWSAWGVLLLVFACCSGQVWPAHGRLQITTDGHYLQYEDGTPFFWLGDTGWELFHRLNIQEINHYLQNRKQKGFNVIQAAILAEMDGLRKPNRYGETPLLDMDPDKPNEKYFAFVDTVLGMALRMNIFLGLLPTWGDKVTPNWGAGPVIFDSEKAFRYGLWLGTRYGNYPNIIWILGGDRPALRDHFDWRPVWKAMAEGIQKGSNGKAIFSYHPSGGANSSSQYLQQENWLSINMIQSGHGSGHDVEIWKWIARDRSLFPTKPVLDGEPNYEDHPVNPWPKWDPANGYFRDYDVRKQTYRSVFAGACGVTYGHHAIWQFYSPREEKINHADRYWTEAMDRPGAFQVGYLRRLVESRPCLARVPDQTLLASRQGQPREYIAVFRGMDNSYAMCYVPIGQSIRIHTAFLRSAEVLAWWFNPQNGVATKIGRLQKNQIMTFRTPTKGVGHDWVLILDDPNFNYTIPGEAN